MRKGVLAMRHVTVLPLVTAVTLTVLASSARAADFRRGDTNADGGIDISDPTFTLRHLFTGGRRGLCDDAMDANDDGQIDISDAIHGLVHLFLGGPGPAAPGPECGPDPTADALGCDEFAPCRDLGEPSRLARLKAAEGCEEVLDDLRGKLVASMEGALAQNLESALQWAQLSFCWDDWLDLAPGCPACGGPVPAPPEDGGGDAASEFSDTNNQVEGVDEADFVKTDGAYIYIVAGGRFEIIDAWPAAEATKVASVEVEGTPKKLFVLGDRAVVFSSGGLLHEPSPGWEDWSPVSVFRPGYGECTYGYDCEFTGDGRRLEISVFDISDRTRPALLRTIELSGSYLNSRRIGDAVHTVVVFPEVSVPGLEYWPPELDMVWDFCWRGVVDEFPFTEEEIRAMFEELRQRNLELIESAGLVDLLPGVRDTYYDVSGPVVSEGLLQDCRDFYISGAGDGRSFLSLVSFELDELGDLAATTIIDRPGAVYASMDTLYVATRHHGREVDDWYFPSRETTPEATTVHKFELSSDELGSSYAGSGVVKGRVLNQFSMDEHEGFLRIATTTGRVPSPSVHSTVSVLAEEEDGLVLLGQVDNIAPTEDIRSVRFSAERGYVVTFKKTDPLFVLDLSVPSDPLIRGELKIPGFSTYMHILDEDHILSIGYDADDQGDFAWFQGILLQVIDVADPDDPRLLHREVIGSRGSTSDAATDHLAFNYFRARGLLAVPMVVCEGGGGGRFGFEMTFSGLMVYRVGADSGFEYVGGVPHAAESEEYNCSNWWTRSNSHVKRSIFMEDWVYSIALDAIDVAHLDDLAHPTSTIPLAGSQ